MGRNLSTVFKNETWAQLKTADNYAKPFFSSLTHSYILKIYILNGKTILSFSNTKQGML